MLNTVHHTQAEVTVDGQPVTVHAVACGTVTIKRWHHSGPLPEWVPAPVRFAAVLADRRFAAPLPIWAYVVQTPDAVVVIDTGADPGYTDPTRWAGHEGARRFVHSFIRLDVTAAQTLPARLAAAGLDPADVDAVVLTHHPHPPRRHRGRTRVPGHDGGPDSGRAAHGRAHARTHARVGNRSAGHRPGRPMVHRRHIVYRRGDGPLRPDCRHPHQPESSAPPATAAAARWAPVPLARSGRRL